MKISKGLATWAGLIAALGQYAGAIALFLEADDQALAIAPLVTATGVLWKVIEGRMNQATAVAARPPTEARLQAPAVHGFPGSTGTFVTSTFTQPRPGAEVTDYAIGEPRDPNREVPGGSVPTSEDPE